MRLFISVILAFTILTSCGNEEVANYEVGGEFLEDNVTIRVIDSFTVKASTFKQDNLVTSSTGRILIGSLIDDVLGNVTVQPYFELTSEDDNFINASGIHVISNQATYDSIGFVMNVDTYYEGDTTKVQTYKFHEIIEEVLPTDDNTAFFNSDTLQKSSEILGEISFIPRPSKTSDSLYIPLSNSFGQRIFNAIENESIESSNDFVNEFNGMTIVPERNDSHILGFNIETTEDITENAYMRLYYTDDGEDDQQFIDFFVSATTQIGRPKQFNSILIDDSTIDPQLLPILGDSEAIITSGETQNSTFVQSGTGISTRIDMRSIRKLKEISEFGSVLSAELTFKPNVRSFNTKNDLQESLSVFIVDEDNEIIRLLTTTDSSGNTISNIAVLNTVDDAAGTNANIDYTIDLSGFVNEILESDTILDYALMIQFNDFSDTVERTVIDTDDDSLKLSIKYLTF